MSAYVMSDIHGCYDEFQLMLEKIGFSNDDQLIMAGDYIDRGSKSLDMLKWIESCPENALLLRGNHDEEFALYVGYMKRFNMKDEEFVCENCGKTVEKLNYTARDHCPFCLYSKHVDKDPRR